MSRTLFLSYSWANTDIANKIDAAFQPTGVYIKRDVRELAYKGSIKEFMQQIRVSDFALIVISDQFLKSVNCMFETLELLKDYDFKNKIIPIIADGTKLFTTEERLEYIKYWTNKHAELEFKLKSVTITDALELYKELKHIENIKMSIDVFLAHISGINVLSYSQLSNDHFKSIFDYIGVSDDVLIKRILSLGDFGTPEEKEIELDKLEAEYPLNAKIYFVKAHYAFIQKQINKSNYFYEKSISLDDSFSPSYYNLGYNKEAFDKDFNQAKKLYEKAIELNPHETRALINLGRLYSVELNLPEKAKELYEAVLEINPYDESGHFNLAYLLHLKFKDFERAKYHYEMAIEILPNTDSLHNYGMLLWKHLSRFNDAKEQFLKVLQIDPLKKNTLKQLGFLLEREYKHYNTAKIYFDRFIKVEPNIADDHDFYASFLMLHFLKSHKDLARHHYETACALQIKYKSKHKDSLLY